MVCEEHLLPPGQPSCLIAQPSVRVGDLAFRTGSTSGPPARTLSAKRRDAINCAEQARMTGDAAKRERVLIMDFAAHQPAAPGTVLGCRGPGRIGPEAETWPESLFGQRDAGDPLDQDPEEDEVQVGIDRPHNRPGVLEDVGLQRLRIVTKGVERWRPSVEMSDGSGIAQWSMRVPAHCRRRIAGDRGYDLIRCRPDAAGLPRTAPGLGAW